MHEIAYNVLWVVVFIVVGAVSGIIIVMLALAYLPRIIDKLTPSIDEEKEIIRGNRAVADYFGKVVAAGIIGISMIVAAAVLGGIVACFMP